MVARTHRKGDFAQQEQFDQLGEQEKFIMAYAIADQERTAGRGGMVPEHRNDLEGR